MGWGGGRAWQSARERSAPARAMAVESGLDAKWCAPRRARGARCRRRRPTPLPRFTPFDTHTHPRRGRGARADPRAPLSAPASRTRRDKAIDTTMRRLFYGGLSGAAAGAVFSGAFRAVPPVPLPVRASVPPPCATPSALPASACLRSASLRPSSSIPSHLLPNQHTPTPPLRPGADSLVAWRVSPARCWRSCALQARRRDASLRWRSARDAASARRMRSAPMTSARWPPPSPPRPRSNERLRAPSRPRSAPRSRSPSSRAHTAHAAAQLSDRRAPMYRTNFVSQCNAPHRAARPRGTRRSSALMGVRTCRRGRNCLTIMPQQQLSRHRCRRAVARRRTQKHGSRGARGAQAFAVPSLSQSPPRPPAATRRARPQPCGWPCHPPWRCREHGWPCSRPRATQ